VTVRRDRYHDLVDEKADLYRTAQGSEVQLHRRTKSAGRGSIPQRAYMSIKENFRSLNVGSDFQVRSETHRFSH
jgi:hypothetical protein